MWRWIDWINRMLVPPPRDMGRSIVNRRAGAYIKVRVPSTKRTVIEPGMAFDLGDWRVQPGLNRLTRGGETVQLEPRAMDVLLCLAERTGELVTKSELIEAAWQTEFVSENTLASRIAELRQALGDSAREPRYIETIPKGGYRVVASVTIGSAAATVTPFPVSTGHAEREPYPGLRPFCEHDSEFFFGREREVVELWRKISARRLLAVVGPSGVGKSSLLRAGVMPAAPEGWRVMALTPGDSPFGALGRALLPEFRESEEDLKRLVDLRDHDTAVGVFSRWRALEGDALLVVDQFEELFTLNPLRVQQRFIALLRRLVDAAGVHVVLVLRDDFLLVCHGFEELAPIFRDLMPIGPPSGPQLRRALTGPAAKLLYRFEDESLADDMADDVAGERAALSMLAFAMAQLWERRDTSRRLITRESYISIGGVAGALVAHAEDTLEAVGRDGIFAVREIFRNLETPQGTRVSRNLGELLSIFSPDDRPIAERVVSQLIEARLLTSYEQVGDPLDGGGRKVEMVHESLLSSWPRVVRWRAQDADGAMLHSQLRQAAEMWVDRDRSRDVLWTGSTVRELRLWLERTSVRLTPAEAGFVEASLAHANRHRARTRRLIAAVVMVSIGVATITTHLWWQSVKLTRRVEARRLLDLARDRLQEMPPVALAHAVASLGLVDDVEARDVALEALLNSPMPRIVEQARVPDNPVTSVDFSPDGLNLVLGHWRGAVQIWDQHGGLISEWSALDGMAEGQGQVAAWFTPDSRVVATTGVFDRWFKFWDASSNTFLKQQEKTGWRPPVGLSQNLAGTTAGLVRFVPDQTTGAVEWSVDRRAYRRLRDLVGERTVPAAVDRKADLLVFATDGDLFAARLSHLTSGDPWLVARSPRRIEHVALCPGGQCVAAVDVSAAVSLWRVGDGPSESVWSWPGADLPMRWALRFDPSGRFLAAGTYGGGTLVWDLDGPPDADPLWLSWPGGQVAGLGFHPTEPWLATCNVYGATVWCIERDRHPYLLRGHSQSVQAVAFGPDGRWLVSAADDGTVRFWPLDRSAGTHGRIIHDWGAPIEGQWLRLGVLPDARSVAVAGGPDGVWLIPLQDGEAVRLEGAEGQLTALAVDTERRRVAASGVNFAPENIFVWDLDKGTSSVLALGRDRRIHDLAFHGDRELLASADDGDLLRVDFETGAASTLSENVLEFDLAAKAHTLLAWGDQPDEVRMVDLRTGAEQLLAGRPDPGPAVALDPNARLAVSSGPRKAIQVGSTAGEIPGLLIGHQGRVTSLAVSRDGRWIASASSSDSVIRLWANADMDATHLHALSRRELIQRLHATTNLLVVRAEQDPGRYKLEVGAFSGWVTPPPL